jgi:hypothetical protein
VVEYLIKRPDGGWLGVEEELLGPVLTPSSVPSEIVSGWGNHRIRIGECELSFSFEDAGIQIVFDGEIEPEEAMRIADEIRANVERATGQRAALVEL